MRLGLFGGTFDPIHSGHVAPVREARETLGLERVIYLPTALPPHKRTREFAPAHARYAMVEMALLDEEGLYASAHELTPGRPAFTVETLEHFRDAWPGADLHLLLGSDALSGLDSWHRWLDILSLARLVILARPGWELAAVRQQLPEEVRALWSGTRPPAVVERRVDASSTHLREILARGEKPPEGTMHPLVLDYVTKYVFYR